MVEPDEQTPGRALLVALAAMAGVALLVGLAVGGVLVAATNLSGSDSATGQSGGGPESLFIPKYQPTKATEDDLGLPDVKSSPTQEPVLPSEDPTPRADRITLFVAPQQVAPGERINFNGVYGAGEGVSLQIQRKEGGVWTDFPVSASVRGGLFETWIMTSRTGRAQFRVYDEQAERKSNTVIVQIG